MTTRIVVNRQSNALVTPPSYHYYTGRYLGMVGGFPQTSLLNARGPQTGIANIKLVGDSIFPGQSTAAVTLGGYEWQKVSIYAKVVRNRRGGSFERVIEQWLHKRAVLHLES